jgi:hypothetical protein
VTGPRDPDFGAHPPSERHGPDWPERDLRSSDAPDRDAHQPGEPSVSDAPVSTGWNDRGWDPNADRRRPTTAEQAVPWLIGVILLLAGMVIVLLALIFTSENGMLAGPGGSPAASPDVTSAAGISTPSPMPEPAVSAEPTATPQPTVTPEPTPTPTPGPTYGPLEMVYLARTTALGPAWIFRRDFSTTDEAVSLAQAEQGILRYDWAPDGTVGVAVISGRLVAITPGSAARNLGDDILTGVFGLDANTVYAVRITQEGADDVAEIVEIDFASGESTTLATITHERPAPVTDSALRDAQFGDNGGRIRLYVLEDGNVVLWVRAASIWEIDAARGEVEEVDSAPVLWSPDGRRRVEAADADGVTTLTLFDSAERSLASSSVPGLVSHLRWSPDSSQVVFTLGRSVQAGGVRQDLFIWNLEDGAEPMALTNNGASFGADWLGAPQSWRR